MSQQEKLLKPQAKQRLDTLAVRRIEKARADLLRQAGAEITNTVAKLNQRAEKEKETARELSLEK